MFFIKRRSAIALIIALGIGSAPMFALASTIGNSWTKATAPALTHPSGVASDPSVLKDGSMYRMVYTCLIGYLDRTALCESASTDGGNTWTPVNTSVGAGEPVGMVLKGATGAWDENLETGDLIKAGSTYYLYYSGYIKASPINPGKIGLATSNDGINFTRVASAPILTQTANSYDNDALFSPIVKAMPDGTFAMIYAGHSYCAACGSTVGVQILGATSPDGRTWTKRSTPLLRGGTYAWTQDGVAEPDMVDLDGVYYLFVTGLQDSVRAIGIATSSSFFGPYAIRSTPAIVPGPNAFDAGAVLAPSVLIDSGTTLARMWYLAYSSAGAFTIGYASSAVSQSAGYDSQAPTVPSNLTAAAISSSQINLSWSASTDNAGVTGYKVFRNGAQIATVAGTSYSDTGRAAGTTYSYSVAAYDAAGNTSGQSANVNAVTRQPSPTVFITASPASIIVSQTSTLTWSSTNATSCTGTNFSTGGSIANSVTVIPPVTTTYSVTCSGTGGTSSPASSVVTVSSPTSSPFMIGTRVKTTANLNVRNKANLNVRNQAYLRGSRILCVQPAGVLGTLTSGPQSANGYTWWYINYDTSCDGWSVQDYLTTDLNSTNTVAGGPFGSTAFTTTLVRGSSGPEVSLLQQFLQRVNYFTGEVTGYFGSLTEISVIQFQAENNLSAVGIVGPKTRALLNSLAW